MSLPGKDLTAMMSGEVPPPAKRKQQPTYPAPAQAGEQYAVFVEAAPTRGLAFGGNGQWRTIFKQIGKPVKTTFTTERPTVTTSGDVVHLHSERFDFILNISKIEELEIEFGEVPPREEPHADEREGENIPSGDEL